MKRGPLWPWLLCLFALGLALGAWTHRVLHRHEPPRPECPPAHRRIVVVPSGDLA